MDAFPETALFSNVLTQQIISKSAVAWAKKRKLIVFPKVPVFKCQKMALRAPKSSNGLKNLAKHPPKWWGRHLVHLFPCSAEYQANL